MGNQWNKTILKKDDVEANIKTINDITKKPLIMEFIGLSLKFSLKKDSLFSKKHVIKVKIHKYNINDGKIEQGEKKVNLNIEQFYKYYNALVNSLSSFYEQKLGERLTRLSIASNKSFGADESSFCPICEENKVNLSLPCNHFFCEQCINDWIIKSDTCPLCRLKLQKKATKDGSTPKIVGSEYWSILDNDEALNEEIKKDNVDSLLRLTKDLFGKK